MAEDPDGFDGLPSTDRRAWDERRSGEERRIKSGGSEGQERRREMKRRSEERRRLRFRVMFTTSGPIGELEEWLEANCQGEWDLVLESMDDELVRKTILFMFEYENDRERFKKAQGRGGAGN